MLRALRPDRMTYAIATFIEEKLGARYVEARTVEFAKSFEETSPSTPIFFILSPGVNPLKVIIRGYFPLSSSVFFFINFIDSNFLKLSLITDKISKLSKDGFTKRALRNAASQIK